ncbi:hypothetical protein TWF481_001185 [Arthrobotrys musiformis]|uniref:Uncharacterized protein n=1 Tax=Arthrobotrys musiformis TaxID=47236 RepID=A0AAV9WPT0_9PEZI
MHLYKALKPATGAVKLKCNSRNNILSIFPAVALILQFLGGINTISASPISHATTLEGKNVAPLRGDKLSSQISNSSVFDLANPLGNTISPVVVRNLTDSTLDTTAAPKPKILEGGDKEEPDTLKPEPTGSSKANTLHDAESFDKSPSIVPRVDEHEPIHGPPSYIRGGTVRVVCPLSATELMARMKEWNEGTTRFNFEDYGGNEHSNAYLFRSLGAVFLKYKSNKAQLQQELYKLQIPCYTCQCNENAELVYIQGSACTIHVAARCKAINICHCEVTADIDEGVIEPSEEELSIVEPIARNLRLAHADHQNADPFHHNPDLYLPGGLAAPVASPGLIGTYKGRMGFTYGPNDLVNIAPPGKKANFITPDPENFYWRDYINRFGPGPGGGSGSSGFSKRELQQFHQGDSTEQSKPKDMPNRFQQEGYVDKPSEGKKEV